MIEYFMEISEYPDSNEKEKLNKLIEKDEAKPKKRYLFTYLYDKNILLEKVGSLETVGKDGITIKRLDGSIYPMAYTSSIKIKELKEETSKLVAEVLNK